MKEIKEMSLQRIIKEPSNGEDFPINHTLIIQLIVWNNLYYFMEYFFIKRDDHHMNVHEL